MATATFSDKNHEYVVDGEVIPSVTQVLSLAGISDVSRVPAHILERARCIGAAVHDACQFLDESDLDLDSLDPQIVGYVVGYQKFKEERAFEPRLVEHRGIGELSGLKYGYCVDRVGTWKDEPILLDIKTSSRVQASWAIQTAAYADAVGHFGARIVVHVAKDGTYQVIHNDSDEDIGVWKSALIIAHWRLRNGAKIRG